MPTKPPIAVKMIDENVRKLSPHRLGIIPPTVEPTNNPIQISDLEFMGSDLLFLILLWFLLLPSLLVVSFSHCFLNIK